MNRTLEEHYQTVFQQVQTNAEVSGQFVEDAFFDYFCDDLVNAGEFAHADRARYAPATGGIRVDGYAGDPSECDDVLTLIVLDFSQRLEIERLTQVEMNSAFGRLERFLRRSLDERFRNSLEESSAAFGLADLISKRWSSIASLRFILVSDRQLSDRVDGMSAGNVEDKPITYSVWDIDRHYRFAAASFRKEELIVDLEADFGHPIPLLPAHLGESRYKSYLAVMPGAQLASIYERWGARLLEQNVRVFLQARGGVNKGIRRTLEENPSMFFAYNNGISATAERIDTRIEDSTLLLARMHNFQIVNGGQTTASIHAAKRRKIDLSKVHVQMKLSIVPVEEAHEIVPRISEFANSQNKVSSADFFSNHPFHVRFGDFSRRIFAPSPDGSFRQSKWYYERTRGQYHDELSLLSGAEKRKFDLEFPKSQLIGKTDLAKFLNVWRGLPDIVSKGAQKNFSNFAEMIEQKWRDSQNDINEDFYRQSIAKAIVFRSAERIVTVQPWYQGGYRANIVAYAIAKIGYDCEQFGEFVDFASIWRSQSISASMEAALKVVSQEVHRILISPNSGVSNVTEWAKMQACWSQVKALRVDYPTSWRRTLLDKHQVMASKRAAVKDQKSRVFRHFSG